MSLLLATEITAVATAVLAVGAVVTAILAGLAFRTLAQQVKLLVRQLDDQQNLALRQSEVILLQSQQLDVNRKQLAQQERDLLHREQLLEREQASKVDFAVWPSKSLPGEPSFCLAMIFNNSERPIRNVRCRIDLRDTGEQYLMSWIGYRARFDKDSPRLGTWYRPGYRTDPFAMQAGRTYGFEFDLLGRHDRPWTISARFADDAGLQWQIDSDLHLERLDDTPDW